MNKYSRVRQIGEGAFGKAILVKRKDSARQYVIKEINITKMSAKEREESRKEVAVLAQLKHPNIVCYIESFEEKGSLYIVMNFCSGGDLYGKINERRGVPFQEEQILDWFVQLCLAVKHIHDRKILHRDIKSQNIFLTNSGTVQLGDFGIAKVLNSTAQLAHTCIGTPYYLSPEIVENMPYNNKSDIWSMGCVLYELTTLKHAFEAGNMKNLVLKIIRGSYPPISPQFSYDLRGLIAQLFKRNPRDRPTVNAILKKNFIMQRVRKFLSAQDIEEEFSHTVMHGHKIAKALPPAPKPSADPSKRVNSTPRPGSANKKYDPAAVYGAPLSSSKNRMSGEKKRPSTPGRQAPVPGQVDWEKKKKERQELEEKRRVEMRKRDQEVNERRHRELIEKQKVMRMNKAREEGWKHVIDPYSVDENNRAQTPNNHRPLPVPKVNNGNRNRGDYEAYNQFLGRLHQDRDTPSPVGRNPNHVDVVHMAVPRPFPAGQQQRPPIPQQFNMGPLGVPIAMGPQGVPAALDEAGRDRQLGAQAAQRARVVEDYMQRKRMADLNKMRAQNDLYGMYRPSPADRRTPVPSPRRGPSPGAGKGGDVRGGGGGGGGGGMLGRNREEQEYLEKLRQIRIQNMKDRRAIRGGNVAEHADNKASEDSEERKKNVEALKLQAEQWAEMKKKELEKQRQGIVPVKPATPVPMTGALQAIGALDGGKNPQAGSQGSAGSLTSAMKAVAGYSLESDRPQSSNQVIKDNILKKLNEKNPPRGKWREPASPAVPEEVDRRKWGAPATPAINPADEEVPESARSQWGGQKDLHLTNIPLELTGSQMEATSVRDQVIKMNAADGKNKEMGRSHWGRRSDVVRALDKMPIIQDTVTINGSSEAPSLAPQGPPVGVGSTITSIHKPSGQGATVSISGEDGKNLLTFRRPLPAPSRSGTIVLSHGSMGVSVPVVDESDSAKVDVKNRPTATEAGDNGKLKNDLIRDGAKSVQMNLTSGNFDLINVKLLRTISEPDLTSLCAHIDGSTAKDSLPVTPTTLRRHHSLDLTVVPEADFDDVDNNPPDAQDDEFAEEDILILANDEDDDGNENEGDDEDDDIRSMRETMQSIIDNSDEEEKEKTLVSLQTSGSKTPNKKEHAKKKSKTSKKTEEVQSEQPPNATDEEEEKADDGDDERNDDSDEANLQKETFPDVLILENDDSDEDSTFGDEDEDGGKGYDDRFGRLEQMRKELETAMGVNKLVEVYQVIQKFQEDDDGNMEDGAKEAIKILGPSREHFFPKIFQLVMSDTAFQEDNS